MSGTAFQLFEHASLAPACFAARLGQTVRGGVASLVSDSADLPIGPLTPFPQARWTGSR